MIEILASYKVCKVIIVLLGVSGFYAAYLAISSSSLFSGFIHYEAGVVYLDCKAFIRTESSTDSQACEEFYQEIIPKVYSPLNNPKIKMPKSFSDQDVIDTYSKVESKLMKLYGKSLPPLNDLTHGKLKSAL